MNRIIVLAILMFCLSFPVQLVAQHHDHSRNELGISGGAIYSLDHKEWGSGVHIHYFRTLSDHSKWSLGGMVEYAWVHESHFTVGLGVKYQPIDKLCLGILPGITFLQHERSEKDHSHSDNTFFSIHYEFAYDLFHWDKFHLGPALDFSWSSNDSHLMLGIHAAYCF